MPENLNDKVPWSWFVRHSAILPNLACLTRLQVSQLHHTLNKSREEVLLVPTKVLNHFSSLIIPRIQRLVGIEKSSLIDQVLEVLIVEEARGGIKVSCHIPISTKGT